MILSGLSPRLIPGVTPMKAEFVKAASMGPLIKSNSFDTERGKYLIDIREYNGDIYFFKYRDGDLLECCNLNKKGINEVYR